MRFLPGASPGDAPKEDGLGVDFRGGLLRRFRQGSEAGDQQEQRQHQADGLFHGNGLLFLFLVLYGFIQDEHFQGTQATIRPYGFLVC